MVTAIRCATDGIDAGVINRPPWLLRSLAFEFLEEAAAKEHRSKPEHPLKTPDGNKTKDQETFGAPARNRTGICHLGTRVAFF